MIAHDVPKQDSSDAKVPMTTSGPPTAWEQRRRLVQAIMDSLMSLLHREAGGDGFALRDILRATDVTLDTIRREWHTRRLQVVPRRRFGRRCVPCSTSLPPSWACWCASRCSGTPLMRRSGSQKYERCKPLWSLRGNRRQQDQPDGLEGRRPRRLRHHAALAVGLRRGGRCAGSPACECGAGGGVGRCGLRRHLLPGAGG